MRNTSFDDRIVTTETGPPPSDRSHLKGARLAYAPRQYLELVDLETEAPFREALRRLRDAGAEVAEIDNDFPVSFEQIYDDLKPELREAWSHLVLPTGAGFLTQADYEATLSIDRPELQRRFGEVFTRQGFDALILPTTPCPAPLIDRQAKFTVAGEEVNDLFLAKNTVPASGAGLPGISIPLGLTGNGLPIGIEFDGAPGHDRALLDLARRAQAVFGTLPAPA